MRTGFTPVIIMGFSVNCCIVIVALYVSLKLVLRDIINQLDPSLPSPFFVVGFVSYLRQVHHVDMPPNPNWHCKIGHTILFTSTFCSTFFILGMTFDRFYSIIQPHKAASFNTVKRAKLTVICITLFSVLYHIPHLFIKSDVGIQCVPYSGAIETDYGKFYYWLTYVLSYILPFTLLLIMNSVIIHTLLIRVKWNRKPSDVERQTEGQGNRIKTSEKHIYLTLMMVSFMFIVLTSPACIFVIYIMFFDFTKTSTRFAGYYLFYHIGQKALYTNNAINFFLYVVSGQKFRTDLINLFQRRKNIPYCSSSDSTKISNVTEG